MFSDLFRHLEASIPALQAVTVVGRDGIEIQSHVRGDLPHEVLSAEMNGLLRNIERMGAELGMEMASEVIIRNQAQNMLLFSLSRDLFLLVITGPTSATGATRYQVQRVAHRFLDALQ